MITVEKDSKAEEIVIHATPIELREFAKQLWAISEKAELKGKHKQQFTPKSGSEVELLTKVQGDPRKYSIVKKLTISSKLG
ncbi:MAG: hypothetical protein HRT56_05755 [Coraliomargarita sp.]|nr:hypothetical protein [Gammaproteobacteria bacterium]NQY32658.1 hypothetical protein [Coraliomargarita sp.]